MNNFNKRYIVESQVIGRLIMEESLDDNFTLRINRIKPDDFEHPSYRECVKNWKENKLCVNLINGRDTESYKKLITDMYEALELCVTSSGTDQSIDELLEYVKITKAHIFAKAILESSKIEDVEKLTSSLQDYSRSISQESYINETKDEIKIYMDALNDPEKRVKKLKLEWDVLDKVNYSICPGELVVIGARPGVGKTASMLNFVYEFALQGYISYIVSLEMSRQENLKRLLAIHCSKQNESFTMDKIVSYKIPQENGGEILMDSEGQFNKLADDLGRMPIYFHGNNLSDINTLVTVAKSVHKKIGFNVLAIDYLGLLSGTDVKNSKVYEIAEITRKLKLLAQELNVVVILLCQLRRNNNNEPPTLSDLRDSGAIEQDADKVIIMHKEKDNNDEYVYFYFLKNRNGAAGYRIRTVFDGKSMTYKKVN